MCYAIHSRKLFLYCFPFTSFPMRWFCHIDTETKMYWRITMLAKDTNFFPRHKDTRSFLTTYPVPGPGASACKCCIPPSVSKSSFGKVIIRLASTANWKLRLWETHKSSKREYWQKYTPLFPPPRFLAVLQTSHISYFAVKTRGFFSERGLYDLQR